MIGGDEESRPRLFRRLHDAREAPVHALQRRVPHARVEDAVCRITLAQFGQVQAGAEVLAAAVHHRSAHALGQVLEGVANGQDQAVVEGVALGGAVGRDHGHFGVFATQAQAQVGVVGGHGVAVKSGLLSLCIIVINNNQIKLSTPFFAPVFTLRTETPWTTKT